MTKRKTKNNSNIGIYAGVAVVILFVIFLFTSKYFNKPVKTSENNNSTITGQNIGNENTNNSVDSKYYIGDSVSGTGTMSNIGYHIQGSYQNKLIFNDGEFYVKSDKYILNDFSNDKVSFSGTISTYATDNIPVLDITHLQKIQNETANQDMQDDENNKKNEDDQLNDNTYLVENGLILNFEGTKYSIKQEQANIIVNENIDGEQEEIAKIVTYTCTPGSNLYDCVKFKNERAKTFKYSKTTNNKGLVFYKIPETDQYVAIGEEYGYNIFSSSDNFLKITNYLSLQDKDTQIEQLIKNTCKSNKIEISEIINTKKTGQNYEVTAIDQNSNKIICKLTISGTNQLIGKLLSLNFVNENTNSKPTNNNTIEVMKEDKTSDSTKKTETPKKDDTKNKKYDKKPEPTEKKFEANPEEKKEVEKELKKQLEDVFSGDLQDIDDSDSTKKTETPKKDDTKNKKDNKKDNKNNSDTKTNNESSAKVEEQANIGTGTLDKENYLVFKSKGYPYTLYMPKSVKYESLVTDENFGISGLTCKQVTNIADWKTGDLETPNLRVYYCLGDISGNQVAGFLKQKEGSFQVRDMKSKIFIIEYLNDSLSQKMLNTLKTF